VTVSRDTNGEYLTSQKLGSPLLVLLGHFRQYVSRIDTRSEQTARATARRLEMTEPHEAFAALMTICAFVALVIFAIGIQSLQAWLEQWSYDRHFYD
jgi:hypothetical protein